MNLPPPADLQECRLPFRVRMNHLKDYDRIVGAISTESLRNLHKANERFPLTTFSVLRPLYLREVDTAPEIVKATEELKAAAELAEDLPYGWKWHDYQPEYPTYRGLWRDAFRRKAQLKALRKEAFARLRSNSKHQKKILLSEIAKRRLLGTL